jgi:hypothetical protein
MNPLDIIREEGKKLGVKVSENDADNILWSCTGWPAFWNDDPEVCIRRDAKEYLESVKKHGWKEAWRLEEKARDDAMARREREDEDTVSSGHAQSQEG